MAAHAPLAALLPLLLAMVLVWFYLVASLFKHLKSRHPSTYEAMGRPTLILRNTLEGNWQLFCFLALRRHRALGDRSLSRLCDGMLAYFMAYLLVFAATAALIMAIERPA